MTSTELLRNIVAWAKQEGNVLSLVMTGSQAQEKQRGDGFSDLDLEIIALDPNSLAQDDGWLRRFAPVWTYQPLSEGQPYPTRLVFYNGGFKVDFTLADSRRLLDMIEAGRLDDLYERGYDVLVDKAGLTVDLPRPTGKFPVVTLPEQQEFQAAVEEFWFEAAHIPKYLIRSDLWVVKFRDWTMKCMLLKLMEWHAIALSDVPVDVRYIGTHARDWLEASVWNDLQRVFGHFDAKDSWRALLATMDLFRRLCQEIAAHSQLVYPQDVDDNISAYILSFDGRMG